MGKALKQTNANCDELVKHLKDQENNVGAIEVMETEIEASAISAVSTGRQQINLSVPLILANPELLDQNKLAVPEYYKISEL